MGTQTSIKAMKASRVSAAHWVRALTTFVVVTCAGCILLPFFRRFPRTVHDFVLSLRWELRVLATGLTCCLYAYVLVKLLSPKWRHIRHARTHPPTWFAWLCSHVCLATLDLNFGLSQTQAAPWEWLTYGCGSLGVVAVHRAVNSLGTASLLRKVPASTDEWFGNWLDSDGPAQHDLLGTRPVADRLRELLHNGSHSIGLVGPFGAGKSTVIRWTTETLQSPGEPPEFFVSHHTCWGFENSTSAIQQILTDAIETVDLQVDTFNVGSLPESYRQTFSAGSQWVRSISDLILGKQDVHEQFARLSRLLGDFNAKLVIVVEDLDRNKSQAFDAQDVLAFLQQLKSYDNLVFILTGGLSSSQKIDFAKLCDHIEMLPSLEPTHVHEGVAKLYEWSSCEFDFALIGETGPQPDWSPSSGILLSECEVFSFPQAVSRLLRTPRSLRHMLGRTRIAWRTLHGEVNFTHLLALNAVRFGAPECFSFLLGNWERLHALPDEPWFGEERQHVVRNAVCDEWVRIIEDVEWSPKAAVRVLERLIPACKYWLVNASETSDDGFEDAQGIHLRRYWRRAISESIGSGEVRDQVVLADTKAWLLEPSPCARMVTQVVDSEEYLSVWDAYGWRCFYNTDATPRAEIIFAACGHILSEFARKLGSEASHQSVIFDVCHRLLSRVKGPRKQNWDWLRDQISTSAQHSVALVTSLWNFYGVSGYGSLIPPEDSLRMRGYAIAQMRLNLITGESLSNRLSQKSGVLFDLVYDKGSDHPLLTGPKYWSWLGPIILAALRERHVNVAANTAVLLGGPNSQADAPAVERATLEAYFGDDTQEAVNLLDELTQGLEHRDPNYRLMVNVIKAAHAVL